MPGLHDNLKTFTKYSERSVQNIEGLPQLSVHWAISDDVIIYKS